LDRYKTQNTVKIKEEQRVEVDKAEDRGGHHFQQQGVQHVILRLSCCYLAVILLLSCCYIAVHRMEWMRGIDFNHMLNHSKMILGVDLRLVQSIEVERLSIQSPKIPGNDPHHLVDQ
jgi:hypothetical protein